MSDRDFCRAISLAANEPLHGTANDQVTTWVLLEHEGRWGPNTPGDAEGLSARARDLLTSIDEHLPGARAQLVRRAEGAGTRRRLLVVRADGTERGAFAMELEHDEQIADVDLGAMLEGRVAEARAIHHPIYLVCTHGTRDACCAKWGRPVFQALDAHRPGQVWQSSHIGGHRFAATLAVLPQGFVYGRVERDEVEALAEAVEAGELYDLARVRGRAAFTQPLQAAELLLRQALGELRVDELRLVDHELAGDLLRAEFERPGGRRHFIEARRRPELAVLGSCGDAAPKRFRPFERTAHG